MKNDAHLPNGMSRREHGQTASFNGYEWIYSPNGLTAATWRQIGGLRTKGEGPIKVIEWPQGVAIYDSQWPREQCLKALRELGLDDSDSAESPLDDSDEVEPTTLTDVDPEHDGIPYTQWKANQLNKLFRRHGTPGQHAHIIAAAVADSLTLAGIPWRRDKAELFQEALEEASRAYAAKAEADRRNEETHSRAKGAAS
jgi:hypothetical protein